MGIFLYNSLTRGKTVFEPADSKRVRMYTCGPTVYDYVHIGNLRAYLAADVLRRVLAYNGYPVTQIENITDVGHLVADTDFEEDKMMKALRREGLPASVPSLKKLAQKYTAAFKSDIKKLNILPPKKWTPATRYVKEMVKLIQKIEGRGFAYETELAVYFDVAKMEDYTRLSGQNIEEKIVGARSDVTVDPRKRHPADFALWFKLAGKNKNHVMHWPSPWGIGFPGWHIECSAMSLAELGEVIDIHTGGIDHISIHHTNERAQNYAALGTEAVRWWVHNEFLVVNQEKMAKSAGTFITLGSLLAKGFGAISYRYFCLNTHYRQKLMYSDAALRSAQNAYNKLREVVYGLDDQGKVHKDYEEKFQQAINDDLNTPQALGVMWQMLNDRAVSSGDKKMTLLKFDEVLGLQLKLKIKIPKEVKNLSARRNRARQQKDWKGADQARQDIELRGFLVKDSENGTIIIPKPDFE